jgi:hypothetical protein
MGDSAKALADQDNASKVPGALTHHEKFLWTNCEIGDVAADNALI